MRFLLLLQVDIFSNDSQTVLMFAAQGGHTKLAKQLIDLGCPVDARDVHGSSPLCYATRYCHTTTAQLLLSEGCDVNVQADFGWTPLMYVAQSGDVALCRALIESGCDLHASNDVGATALSIAQSLQQEKVVQVINTALELGGL